MLGSPSLASLALSLRGGHSFEPRAWAGVWPGVGVFDPESVIEASLSSIVRRQHKALLTLRLRGDLQSIAGLLLEGGLDLRRGHASRGDEHYYLEAEDGGVRLEAHLDVEAMEPKARLVALASSDSFGPELVALAISSTLVDASLTRSEVLTRALVLHLEGAYDAEQELIAAGFGETEIRGVPALVRSTETVLLAGGTWYAYAGALPAELPISADD